LVGQLVVVAPWNQEVSHVNQFFVWAVRRRLVGADPAPQRARRPVAPWTARSAVRGTETVPATYAHDEDGERVEGCLRTKLAKAR
jgi:hypothetical protein